MAEIQSSEKMISNAEDRQPVEQALDAPTDGSSNDKDSLDCLESGSGIRHDSGEDAAVKVKSVNRMMTNITDRSIESSDDFINDDNKEEGRRNSSMARLQRHISQKFGAKPNPQDRRQSMTAQKYRRASTRMSMSVKSLATVDLEKLAKETVEDMDDHTKHNFLGYCCYFASVMSIVGVLYLLLKPPT
eukprot:CAMPEP_0183739518 /NCGR_PEP_ID=MMETSP0737-20130205/57261_1 /TAXON_ID=385413 /ORGANISM="Thalassiosira miniscula, Strain CCMP1093" /LENGTH=187 /DNA_ID=CAMNT_0025974343 /DNA_START=135 /DNA_END=698 /DNA_ORIENTATION=-